MLTAADLPGHGAAPRRPCMPALSTLTYAKELMTVVLLALTFAWLLPRLVLRPGATLASLGRRAGRV